MNMATPGRSARSLTVCAATLILIALGLLLSGAFAQAPRTAPDLLTVEVNRPGAGIAPTMFGIFFEDINFAADGGLYPEKIANRSFEFTEPLSHWSKLERGAADGELLIRAERPLNPNNPHYLTLRVHTIGSGFGASNSGLRGIAVQAHAEYILSAWVRGVANGPRTLRLTVNDERGAALAEASFTGFTAEWKRYEARVRTSASSNRAQFNLLVTGPGDIDLDMVSLFPVDTFKGRPNGLRKDLGQLLADLKPGFIRFPGGCIVEGRRLELRYRWKQTVGDISDRRAIINRWADENQRVTPDYFQSYGLGFFEYFQLAEDIGASPVPILNCGMACQFNSGEMAALNQLDEYIQDALDLIEFANGPVSSRWGALRARMGHPATFNLKMLGIGNEQWGGRYIERYQRFAQVLKAKHPEIQLVSGSGPSASGDRFDFAWSKLRELKADIVDEHYYMAPQWFLNNAGRYDHYDRHGPKVFAGEYAAHTAGVGNPNNRGNWQAALSEAAFMTGLERNADVVVMSSYAPLFAHVDAWQWSPDLIWFDNTRSYGAPSYYVQKLFGANTGNRILPVSIDGASPYAQNGLYASASLDERTGEVIVKAVNSAAAPRPLRVAFGGATLRGAGRLITLAAADLAVENTLDAPTRLAPVETPLTVDGPELRVTVLPNSLTVLRLPRPR
jgi:alpha-L-arabinofuranosidase